MPYAPGIQDQRAQYTSQGFGAIASGIQDLMKKQEEERLKQELIQRDISKSDIIVNHAKQSGLISENDWHDYVTAAGTKKVDIAQGLAANMVTDQIINKQRATANQAAIANQFKQDQMLQQGMIAAANRENALKIAGIRTTPQPGQTLVLTPEEQAAAAAAGKIPLRQSKGSFMFANDPKVVAVTDNFKKLSDEMKAAVGVTPGDVQQATNHRIEGDMFKADKPNKDLIQIPVGQYTHYLDRYNAIQHQSDAGMGSVPISITQPPAATPAPAASAAQAVTLKAKAEAAIRSGKDPAAVQARLLEELKKIGVTQ